MRKQLLLSVPGAGISAADWDAIGPADPDDRGRGLGDNATQKPRPSGRRAL
jgi:hypothetical protein